ncbi:MAG TPA: cell division protein ZapA [Gammaproteobacteria bacterium]
MSTATQEKVRLLDKDYAVTCPPEEREALLDSARLLDSKMREIRDSGKIIGTERIAVMAALNLAHELLLQRTVATGKAGISDDIRYRLRMLQERIEAVLEEDRQLRL